MHPPTIIRSSPFLQWLFRHRLTPVITSCTPSLLAIPAHTISSVVVHIHFFLTVWLVRSHAQQVLSAYLGLLGVLNLVLPKRLSLAPLAHLPQLLKIPPVPCRRRNSSQRVCSLGVSTQHSPQSTCPLLGKNRMHSAAQCP